MDLEEPKMSSIPLLPAPYQPGGGPVNHLESVDAMLQTEFAPPDRYFTVSALIGRLRDPMKLPHPPNARVLHSKSVGAGGVTSNAAGNGGETEQEKKRKQTLLEKQQV